MTYNIDCFQNELPLIRIFSNSKKIDLWDNLSDYQKDEILKGIDEIENGETVNYEEFIKNHK